jgi:outer membrane protein OmpA-like peptidoglycan-associated protein
MTSKHLRKMPPITLAALAATTVLALAPAHAVEAYATEAGAQQTGAQDPSAKQPLRLAQAPDKAMLAEEAARKEKLKLKAKGIDQNAVKEPVKPATVKKVQPVVKTITKPPVPPVKKPVVLPKVLPPPAVKTAKPILKPVPVKPVVKAVVPPAHNPPAVERRNPVGFVPLDRQFPKGTNKPPVVVQSATKPAVKTLRDAQAGRVERHEAGGKRIVIKEADKRTIVRQGNRVVIQKDESAQIKRLAPTALVTRDRLGRKRSVVERANNTQVITETDRNGQLLRRYRRDRDGRETAIIDNRRRKGSFGRDLAIGVGVGAGIIAGAAILNSVVDVPPPRVRVPRDKYIVEYERANDEDVYEALNAPPVDEVDRRYTLDQVRATPRLRDRMRRIDLDDINFETGSWDVDPSQYRKLERIARAMNRVISRNPNEVFLIEGYTDAVGSDVDNLTLSDRRAESVSLILTEQFDVPFENLTTQGYGEDYLKIDTDGPEIINRRVAVRRITPLLNQDISAAQPHRDRERDNDAAEPEYDPAYDDGRGDSETAPRNRWRRYNR